MSSDYTIDIQLTELGFPDILQPLDTPARETPCHLASSYASLPGSSKTSGRELVTDDQSDVEEQQTSVVTQNIHIQQTTMVSGSTPTQSSVSSPLPPTQRLQVKEADGVCAVDAAKESVLSTPPEPLGSGPNDSPSRTTRVRIPKTTEQKMGETENDNGQKGVNNGQEARGNSTEVENESFETDDSEVSEEEEEEEGLEEEEEEGLENESDNSSEYRCGVCDLQLPSNVKLQEHMNLHTGAHPYGCAECGKRFCQISNYRAHLRTHAQTNPLHCRICLKVFKSKEDLKDHLNNTHFEKQFYECDLCKRLFAMLKDCERHVEWHRRTLGNFICETCGRTFSHQRSLTRHRYKRCQRSYICCDCKRSFTRKNALLKHSFSHLGLLPYTCLRCHCHFRLAKLYRQHKCEPQRIHCVACLRIFLTQEDFQKHKKDTGCWGHQEPKGDEIRCLECGQSFSTAEDLKKHAGAHQRVLSCAECGKGFRSALLLMSHMGGHAGQTPCLCQSCGLGFPHQQGYDSHLNNCGKTPPPAKRLALKSSCPPIKSIPKLVTKVPAKAPTNAANSANQTVTIPDDVLNISATPVENSSGAGPSPAQGVWQLALDKQPPAGVKLVVFVPVNPSLGSGLVVSPVVPQIVPAADVQAQPRVALPPAPRTPASCLGMSSALGAQLHLDLPLGLVMGNEQGPDYEAPLDLSKKSTSAKSALTIGPPVKVEPEVPKSSEEADGIEGEAFQSVDSKQQRLKRLNNTESDIYTVVKQLKPDPIDLSPLIVSATAPGLVMDIKEEALSRGPDFHTSLSKSCQLTAWRLETEMKMETEVDGPGPAYADADVDPVDKLTNNEEGLDSRQKEIVNEDRSKYGGGA